MTALQINAEIYRNLGYLADSETYLQQALNFLRKLSRQKEQDGVNPDVKKIHVDRTRPLPSDKYVGIITSSKEEDEKAREEYLTQKYGI